VARALLVTVLVIPALVLGCTAKKEAAPVDGEPVCPDFDIGASQTKMKGGLRKPIRVTVLDDGDPVSTRILLGRRTTDDAPAKLSVEDDDKIYEVEWAQCANERAPKPLKAETTRTNSETATYACGEAKSYAKSKLEVKAGNVASRSISFVAPATPECWSDTAPPATSPEPAGDAGATEPADDAGPAASSTASASPDALATPSAAVPSASASATPKADATAAPSKPKKSKGK
jgi:hypothetical protein